MKHVFILLGLMLMLSISSYAQKLGDYIEFDGVPSFVFYLDSSGEHGLAMSIPAFDAKGVKKVDKLVKKGLMTNEQANIFKNNPIGEVNNQGIGGKKTKDLFAGLVGRLTDKGKNNQEQILAYCEEYGLSLQEIFPMQYWAKNLGNGWFIPGDQELTLFADFYFGGLGKSHSLGNKFQYHAKDLCNNELIQESLFRMVFFGMFSSSCNHANAGFRKLRCEMVAMSGKHWLEIFDTYSGQDPLVCAVHEF